MKEHKLLMIPGPIDCDPGVLAANGSPTVSHVSPGFIEAHGQALERLRQVFQSADGQPFILPGSGTLAMEAVGANLVEPGDRVLVVNCGVFGDRFGTMLERYGAQVTHVKAAPGDRPTLEAVEDALKTAAFKLMTITHVDTSTGVITDVPALAALGHRYGVLVVVDGVCSVAGEDLQMSAWGVDAALTASQKALATPPGLALFVAGPAALEAFRARKTPVASFYADWANWLPIMQAYEARKGAYFATPAVNLVSALNVSLGQILQEGLPGRFQRHMALSAACKAAAAALGLGQVPVRAEVAAHTLSAIRFPAGVKGPDLLPKVGKAGVILAGGLHPAIKDEYFRVGHMGAADIQDILTLVNALEGALKECGYAFEAGAGLLAAQRAYTAALA